MASNTSVAQSTQVHSCGAPVNNDSWIAHVSIRGTQTEIHHNFKVLFLHRLLLPLLLDGLIFFLQVITNIASSNTNPFSSNSFAKLAILSSISLSSVKPAACAPIKRLRIAQKYVTCSSFSISGLAREFIVWMLTAVVCADLCRSGIRICGRLDEFSCGVSIVCKEL